MIRMRSVLEWEQLRCRRRTVQTIVEGRKESKYRSIFDLAKRVDLRAANKKHLKI